MFKNTAVIGAGIIGLELGSVWRRLGAEAEQDADGTVHISAAGDIRGKATWDAVRKMRGSVCVLGESNHGH